MDPQWEGSVHPQWAHPLLLWPHPPCSRLSRRHLCPCPVPVLQPLLVRVPSCLRPLQPPLHLPWCLRLCQQQQEQQLCLAERRLRQHLQWQQWLMMMSSISMMKGWGQSGRVVQQVGPLTWTMTGAWMGTSRCVL